MATNKFTKALARSNTTTPPVWLMRQAGRYHRHYQNLRRLHGFEELCKNPQLACEVALGPVADFDFDAAILFSDILFPLEVLGMPLAFNPAPQLGFHLKTPADIARLGTQADVTRLDFQAQALALTRKALGHDKGLLGFVGAPLTLYVFAVEGTHKNGIADAIAGLRDGRFTAFMDKLLPLLLDNLLLQASAKPDVIALFDSAAGDISTDDYRNIYLPVLEQLVTDYAARNTGVPLLYYGKGLSPDRYTALGNFPVAAYGIDHHQSMPAAFDKLGRKYALQGNLDPAILTLPPGECQQALELFFEQMQQVPAVLRQGWVCGLGHGITPEALEENVRLFVAASRQTGNRAAA